MKRKVVAAKMTALILAAGMTFGSVSFAAERKDAEAIKEENQATEAVSEGETEAAEGSDSQKKTEYPVTITTYGSDGLELETTYEKAPEKVLAVYQGCIETLLALDVYKRQSVYSFSSVRAYFTSPVPGRVFVLM